MRDGKYEPQQATLRMKQILEDGNPQMWDLAAYRVLQSKTRKTRKAYIIALGTNGRFTQHMTSLTA
jgi:glutamyl/glutaminyl-tRNA synthetase